MLCLVSRIMRGIQQSRALRYQAKAASIQATAARNQANAQAALIEDSARRNARLDADNLMAAAANQREQLATLKNKRATSGFTSQGTADAPIHTAAQELNAEIQHMALSASINSLNAIQTAHDTRAQGELTAMVHEMQAATLRSQAKGIQRSTLTSGIIGTATAAYGAYQGYNADTLLNTAYDNGELTPEQYAAEKNALLGTTPWQRAIATSGYYGSTFYDATAAFNPYTTTMTRKNPWGGLYSLVKGANPGITRNNYNTLFTR
jgi:hypothetical protein